MTMRRFGRLSFLEVFPSLPRFEIPCSIFEISNIFG
jgi:hypothetical protein